jgi:hypothetical protein
MDTPEVEEEEAAMLEEEEAPAAPETTDLRRRAGGGELAGEWPGRRRVGDGERRLLDGR